MLLVVYLLHPVFVAAAVVLSAVAVVFAVQHVGMGHVVMDVILVVVVLLLLLLLLLVVLLVLSFFLLLVL